MTLVTTLMTTPIESLSTNETRITSKLAQIVCESLEKANQKKIEFLTFFEQAFSVDVK